MKFKPIIIIILSLFTASIVFSQNFTAEEIYNKYLPSVTTITVSKNNGDVSLGSAFMAIDEGLAVTAWHVVRDAKSAVVKFSDGEEFEVSGIKDYDSKRDLAIIKVKVYGKKLIPISTTDAKVGETAIIIGAPKGLEYTISDGIVSQVQIFDGVKQVQFTCPASTGNSGGPVINSQGKVIGVVAWGLTQGQNLNFASPSKYILGLDYTLPTKPFNKVELKITEAATVNEELFDEIFAHFIINISDMFTTYKYIEEKLIKDSYGYELPLPYFYYNIKLDLEESINKLIKVKSENEAKERAKGIAINYYQNLKESLELLEKALTIAKGYGGFTYESNELLSKSLAAYVRDLDEFYNLKLDEIFSSSDTFCSLLPAYLQYNLNCKAEIYNFRLGINYLSNMQTKILFVQPKSLAQELDLEIGDRVVSINHKKVKTIIDIMNLLSENRGKETPLVLEYISDYTDELVEEESEIDIPYDLEKLFPKNLEMRK